MSCKEAGRRIKFLSFEINNDRTKYIMGSVDENSDICLTSLVDNGQAMTFEKLYTFVYLSVILRMDGLE